MTLLDEQRAYYRERADVAETEAALSAFAPRGEVLELACGTGLWTRHLARHATRVTAVDAAPEMLARNRERVRGAVRYVVADLFEWTPPAAAFDVCFFGYWLSHVPADRFAAFWSSVAAALRPGGRVFLVDSYHPVRLPADTQERELNDGRRFRVVKRYWQPAELAAATADLGWTVEARVARHSGVLYASGVRSGRGQGR